MKSYPTSKAQAQHIRDDELLLGKMSATPENRFWAKIVDFALICLCTFLFSWVWGPLSFFAPLFFWSIIDKLNSRGQSPGKWLLGLQMQEFERRGQMYFFKGLIRNLPFAVFTWGLHVQSFVGWLLISLSLFAIVVESYFVFQIRSGIRTGDILAGTRVVDFQDPHTLFLAQLLKEENYDH